MSGKRGQVKVAPMHAGQGRQRMWQSMRVLREFSAADLAATAEVRPNSVNHYLRPLVRAGYLRCVQPVQSGRTAGHARYRLVRNPGPDAPRIGAHGVRDPNLQPARKSPYVQITAGEYARALRCIALCELLRTYAGDAQVAGASVAEAAADALEVAR